MGIAEYGTLDAVAMSELLRRREVSPRELVAEAIARIERVDPGLNAVVEPLFDRALEAAASGSPTGRSEESPSQRRICSPPSPGSGSTAAAASSTGTWPRRTARSSRATGGPGWSSWPPPTRPSWVSSRSPSRSSTGPRETRTTSSGRRAARVAARRRSLPLARSPWPTRATAAGQSAFPRRAATCSGSSRRGDGCPWARTTRRSGTASSATTSSAGRCATALRRSTWPRGPSQARSTMCLRRSGHTSRRPGARPGGSASRSRSRRICRRAWTLAASEATRAAGKLCESLGHVVEEAAPVSTPASWPRPSSPRSSPRQPLTSGRPRRC